MIITVFDSESDGFVDKATRLWCIALVQKLETKPTEDFLYGPDSIEQGLTALGRSDVLVGHNIKGHDLPLFKKFHNWEPKSHQIVIDTLVYSRMLNPKRPLPEGYTGKATHSIEAWGYRLGLAKPEHEDWTQYSEAMGHRCMEDARINLLVLEELEREAGSLSSYYEQIKSPPPIAVGA